MQNALTSATSGGGDGLVWIVIGSHLGVKTGSLVTFLKKERNWPNKFLWSQVSTAKERKITKSSSSNIANKHTHSLSLFLSKSFCLFPFWILHCLIQVFYFSFFTSVLEPEQYIIWQVLGVHRYIDIGLNVSRYATIWKPSLFFRDYYAEKVSWDSLLWLHSLKLFQFIVKL